ncbi:MAG: hypothetical protein ACYDBJ_28760 [Aggregatilineales bacterium]
MDISQAIHRRVLIPSYFAAPVIIEAADAEDNFVYLRVRTESGQLEEVTLSQDELMEALSGSTFEETRAIPANEQFLLIETERIRLAYTYDPFFAVSLSGVEPLPHQLEAVYERMLPQARLRFLLADDPGSGKVRRMAA